MNYGLILFVTSNLIGTMYFPAHATICPLSPGEIVLNDPYPLRTVSRTELVVYELYCLGFSSVKQFQADNNLEVDGVIGSQVRASVHAQFETRFLADAVNSDSVIDITLEI